MIQGWSALRRGKLNLEAVIRALAAERMASELPLVEVAARLGVDPSTVSHYLSGDYPSEEARDKIRRIIEEIPPFGLWPQLREALGVDVAAEALKWVMSPRTEAEPDVDDEKCLACSRCSEICPSPDGECLGCGECVRACPSGARSLSVRYRGLVYRVSPLK
ncbi:4Fe-4S binding protein [Methanopyrus sp.]